MRDWLAVRLTGAVRLPKARVLYRDGVLKIYTKNGHHKTLQAQAPRKRRGWTLTWDVSTDQGDLTMSQSCISCGGWWRVVKRNAEELWRDGGPEEQPA